MCGIAAILSIDKRPEAFRSIFRMASTLVHRGPDDAGFLFASLAGKIVECRGEKQFPTVDFHPAIAMGFRRLSIIDLSSSAHQPMCNEDRTLWLVFNGEIYNYIELVSALTRKGHVFRSCGDTEVILHAYEEWGVDCVNHFNGMWAFALWDSRRSRLFCSRDRFGVKPFFYSWDGKTLCLASEPKAIIGSGLVVCRPNYSYLYRFLTDSVLQDKDETFYDGVHSLLPAHSLTVEGKTLHLFRYWDYNTSFARRYDFSRPENAFRELFVDSVKLRLRSDVPLGACLSGGLDSSSIVGVVSLLNGKRSLDTFSAIFDDKRNDESSHVRKVVSACETRSHTVKVDANDLVDVMPKIVWHLDGPCLSASTYPFWKVAELASQRVKVLLDGQGADELLGGYLAFFPACIVSSYRASLRSRSLTRLADTGRDLIEILRVGGWRQLYFLYRDYSYLGQVLKPHRWLLRTEKIINPELRRAVNRVIGSKADSAVRKFGDELTQALYESHSRSRLPGLLQYSDGISMAHSLETRLPFMDYRLVELCFSLPPHTKICQTTTKWLLRQAMREIVPNTILDRKDKIGFATPFRNWIRAELRDFMLDLLGSKSTREHGVFDTNELRKVIQRHLRGQIDMSFYIWRWMTTELWFRQLDGVRSEIKNVGSCFPGCTAKESVSCVSQ